MKELSKYSRLAGYLEKLYDKLNDHFFDGQLDRPVITIQSTPRAYGHYTLYDAWSVKGEGRKEINIGAGTDPLSTPLLPCSMRCATSTTRRLQTSRTVAGAAHTTIRSSSGLQKPTALSVPGRRNTDGRIPPLSCLMNCSNGYWTMTFKKSS